MKALVLLLSRRSGAGGGRRAARRSLLALPILAAALLAPSAASQVPVIESHVDASCESGPVADETSSTGPVSHTGGGVTARANAAARTLGTGTSSFADRQGASHRWCDALSRFDNAVTLGAGTTGKAVGDPVSLSVTVRLQGSLDAGYHGPTQPGDQMPYIAGSQVNARFSLTDPQRPVCIPEDGREICSPAKLATFSAFAHEEHSAVFAWGADPDGSVDSSYRWDWRLSGNRGTQLDGADATFREVCPAWPAPVPCGVSLPTPPPTADYRGTRTVVVDTFVGAHLELRGVLSTLSQGSTDSHASASFADPGDGLAVELAPAPGYEGLELTYDLGSPQRALDVSDQTVSEGDAGQTPAAFTVSLSAASSEPISVAYSTADGTATSTGGDYVATSGTLTFAPGEREKTVIVGVAGDAIAETNETFFLDLADSDGATIGDARGQATILDDDGTVPTISFEDETGTEGTGSTPTTVGVEAVLSSPAATDVWFRYATSDGSATGPADYAPIQGARVIRAGQTRVAIDVSVVADDLTEGDETAYLDLSDVQGANLGKSRAVLTIADDDGCRPTIAFDWVKAEGCFVRDGAEYRAIGDVKVNGLDLRTTTAPAAIMVDPLARRVHSRNGEVQVRAGDFTLAPGPIDWDLPPLGPTEETDVWGFIVGPNDGVHLKGFPVVDIPRLVFTRSKEARLRVPVGVPFLGSVKFGETRLRGDAILVTDSGRGLHSESLRISAENLPIPPVLVKQFSVSFDHLRQRWEGEAKVVVPTPDALEVSGSFAFEAGRFAGASAAVDNLNAPIGGGVYVQAIRFSLAFEPLQLGGGIGVSAGPLVNGKAALRVDGDFSIRFSEPLAVRLSGRATIAGVPLAQAYFRYFSSGTVEFGGALALGLPDPTKPREQPVRVVAGINGWVDGTQTFSAHALAVIDVLGWSIAGGELLVSNIGIAACGQVTPWIRGGFGYRWETQELAIMGPWACSVGEYEPVRPVPAATRAGATAAAQPLRLTLPASAQPTVLKLHGVGGAPQVRLVGPGGRAVATPSGGEPLANDEFVVMQHAAANTTIVAIRRPRGEWAFTELPGSPAIESVERASVLPPASVEAEVRRESDDELELSWRLRPVAGQLVTFVEEGDEVARVLARTNEARGRLSFESSDGPGGTRRIVAVVEQNGVPRERIEVATFRAPDPAEEDASEARRKLKELRRDVARAGLADETRGELQRSLRAARKALKRRPPETAAACQAISAFAQDVEARAGIPPVKAEEWVAAADGIRGLLGCS